MHYVRSVSRQIKRDNGLKLLGHSVVKKKKHKPDTKVRMKKRNIFWPDVSFSGMTAQQSSRHYQNLSTSLKLPSACKINDGHLYSDRRHPIQL